jgi:alkylation response protein AidB-like acyl-CoA dehydrogenase
MLSEAKEGQFKRMDVMHHLLAGYKAVFSERNLFAIEVARKACGGAGYSSHSGIPILFSNASPIPTYEGDNTVMMLQAARYLKKL